MGGYSVIQVRASEVARSIAEPKPAPQSELIFGKIFEEVTY